MERKSRRKAVTSRTEEKVVKKTKTKKSQIITSLVLTALAIFCVIQCVALTKYTFGKDVNESSLWLYRAFQQKEGEE